MEKIEQQYTEAADLIDSIIENLEYVQETLGQHYEGKATEINGECLRKYIDHFDFLRYCCVEARKHVESSKNDITEVG
jgi:Sec7-like guanine-nucleotide exchange factor